MITMNDQALPPNVNADAPAVRPPVPPGPPGRTSAAAEFMTARADVLRLLASLTQHAADNFGTDPDALNWSHVGSAQKTRADLIELAQFHGLAVPK